MSGPSVDIVWEPPSLDCWDYSIELACLQGPEDLQLAAELGKTLLERNKELENCIKLHQSTIEEQAQEIEYMKKQTAALREVNDSRLKIYEQLEISIGDLERANHRLIVDNTADKKVIKSQCSTIENLETRCEELQKKIDDLTNELESTLRRRHVDSSSSKSVTEQNCRFNFKESLSRDDSTNLNAVSKKCPNRMTNDDELTETLRRLQETKSQRIREQKKIIELEQQLTAILQENQNLEEQLNVYRVKAQDVKTLQDEITTLEEVRQGNLCGRCLRGINNAIPDELSIMLDQEEYDDISIAESLHNEMIKDYESIQQSCQNNKHEGGKEDTSNKKNTTTPKPLNGYEFLTEYKILVQKYEALLEVQRQPTTNRIAPVPPCKSLQEELEMSGEFNTAKKKQQSSATPTDFSEAETSSSGFSDETSNKSTQTDTNRPGSFLCSIADGEDCKLSIYDENSPFESRFHKTPEYRQLFSEIFGVLKRTIETKDDHIVKNNNEEEERIPTPTETIDDNQSVRSSIVSSIVSEPTTSTRVDELKSTAVGNRPRLDYLTVNVNVRKKSPSKKHLAKKHNTSLDRSITPDINPKFVQSIEGKGKRKFRPFNPTDPKISPQKDSLSPNQRKKSTSGTRHNNTLEMNGFKPSTASEDVARLKRLEMSYAQVLRMPNKRKSNRHVS